MEQPIESARQYLALIKSLTDGIIAQNEQDEGRIQTIRSRTEKLVTEKCDCSGRCHRNHKQTVMVRHYILHSSILI